jgi:hypothetical protein
MQSAQSSQGQGRVRALAGSGEGRRVFIAAQHLSHAVMLAVRETTNGDRGSRRFTGRQRGHQRRHEEQAEQTTEKSRHKNRSDYC